MRNESAEEDRVLERLAPEGVDAGRRVVAAHLLLGRSLDQPLDLPEQHLQEDGLGAQPAAPDAPHRRRDEGDGDESGEDAQDEQIEVLRPEDQAEDDELPLDDVEEQDRLSVQLHERAEQQQRQQHVADERPGGVEPPGRLACVDPLAPAVGVDTGQFVAERLVVLVEPVRRGGVGTHACLAAGLLALGIDRARAGRVAPLL